MQGGRSVVHKERVVLLAADSVVELTMTASSGDESSDEDTVQYASAAGRSGKG